jgi:hypothetical protein
MAASTQSDLETLRGDIQQLRADFAKMTTDLRTIASNGAAQASGKAQESAQRMWSEGRQKAQRVGHEIEERPFASALGAFSTGLFVGMLLNARRG